MKLLKLKVNEGGFKSLQKGFEINFHTLDDTEAMEQFRPFCFAGLNGSGKSNVLEALSAIFYHLEFLVAAFQPKNFREHFDRRKCYPDAYELDYLISEKDGLVGVANMIRVSIAKEEGEEPVMRIEQNTSWLKGDKIMEPVTLVPPINKNEPATGKRYLPDNIVAYSSGENETLSIPYLKCRLVHYDEYIDAIKTGLREYIEPENSFIYVDSNMSQAVLLTNLIFEDVKMQKDGKEVEGALKSFADEIGIVKLQQFRMNINLVGLTSLEINDIIIASYPKLFTKNKNGELVIVQLLANKIENLKKCCTFFYENDDILALDFYVNDATKEAFKRYFKNSFELFQLFRLLYELNAFSVDDETKEDVYKSKGYYTDWKLPQLVPKDSIFAFTDFFILKKDSEDKLPETRLLKEFSDGEHQFIHTMGICMMLKERRALLLLDEPETHFNPAWRAKFIKILKNSIAASAPIPIKKTTTEKIEINVHPAIDNLDYYVQKDILLTSHSPFIISDCLPDNVIVFEKDDSGNITAKKVSELDNTFNTYGTSVELILDKLFNYRQSIGDLSFSEFEKIDFSNLDSIEKVEQEKDKLRKLGESIEKDMILARLNRISIDRKNA
jgi:restriction system-associated AAA family ATPase